MHGIAAVGLTCCPITAAHTIISPHTKLAIVIYESNWLTKASVYPVK
jgi:hypothetical protein